jgi:hypothetical protein
MSLCVKSIIRNYYNDYLKASYITQTELEELVLLFGIIYEELRSNSNSNSNSNFDLDPFPPTIEDIQHCLTAKIIKLDLCTAVATTLSMDKNTDKLHLLHQRELAGDQRTAEWLLQRVQFITASVSAACAGLMGKASRENQLLEKASNGAYRSFMGGYYTDIGNIYEPVTNSHYNHVNNTRIHDFALIPNDKAPLFLAASTDGVTSDLVNIEIKTLPGRYPDGKVKKEYGHQVQHQMECLGLEQTDFVEAKYEEYGSFEEMALKKTEYCGIIAEIYNVTDEYYEYEYSPVVNSDMDALLKWQQTRNDIIASTPGVLFTRWLYWTQIAYSCINVKRDPTWIKTMGPLLQQFQDEVTALRAQPRKVQQMIQQREQRIHKRRTANNELFHDCML